MVRPPRKDIREVIREIGKYPSEAFQFVQEGLSYTVQELHGEMNEPQRLIHQFMMDHHLDLDQLESLYIQEQLPAPVRELVEQVGGVDELNRHVSGQHLCWGLRNYAFKCWGAMAPAVLHHWNIRRTRDFGEIVFALVNNDFLQKQPKDRLEDFNEVYEFQEAFDRAYQIRLQKQNN